MYISNCVYWSLLGIFLHLSCYYLFVYQGKVNPLILGLEGRLVI